MMNVDVKERSISAKLDCSWNAIEANKMHALLAAAVEKLSKLECDRLRELGDIFLKVADGSIDFNQLIGIDVDRSAGAANSFLASPKLTNGGLDFLVALWAVEGNGVVIEDAHRNLLVDRLLGDINPTTGSSSEGCN